MYTSQNFKTKKELKEAIAAGKQVTFYQPNQMFPSKETDPNYKGTIYLEGPHYPQPHKWYAQAQVKNGVIISVK